MLREEFEEIIQKQQAEEESFESHINVCMSSGCEASGSKKVLDQLKSEVKARDLRKQCQIKSVGCLGLCGSGPVLSVEPDGVFYQTVVADDVGEIVDHLGQGAVERIELRQDNPFFQRQERVVLSNAGKIDPSEIESAIAHGGYAALLKATTEMEPEEVLREITNSGLRGRGGAGYPTGLKWSTVAKMDGDMKYVVCNGDEGDPGAFMDRCIIGSDPHRVIEGMAIAAYAVGATKGYVYIRAEYPLEIKRLKKAMAQAKRYNILGENMMGTSFSFTIDIRLGAGAFVCGEETALIASIHGKRGNPRPRPPYPSERGIFRKPTLINNVETLANIAPIIRNGAEWYASMGTETSKGTKVFALAGQIANTGLIEVPMGISMKEIIYEIGGGVPEGKKVKAVQTGGPSGGCIPASKLDVPVDFESLKSLGSMMGSGGMIVIDETANMLDIAKFFMEFCQTESCGKCIPCRVGTTHMLHILDRFSQGKGSYRELEILKDLCEVTRSTSLCGLGMSAPNPILSTINHFEDEYINAIQPELAGAASGGHS